MHNLSLCLSTCLWCLCEDVVPWHGSAILQDCLSRKLGGTCSRSIAIALLLTPAAAVMLPLQAILKFLKEMLMSVLAVGGFIVLVLMYLKKA